jgi:hypothetical protein
MHTHTHTQTQTRTHALKHTHTHKAVMGTVNMTLKATDATLDATMKAGHFSSRSLLPIVGLFCFYSRSPSNVKEHH